MLRAEMLNGTVRTPPSPAAAALFRLQIPTQLRNTHTHTRVTDAPVMADESRYLTGYFYANGLYKDCRKFSEKFRFIIHINLDLKLQDLFTSGYRVRHGAHTAWPCTPFQSKLVMEGFRSLREGEQVEFTFKRSSKGLESLRVTGPGGGPCSGSDRRPKGKAPPLKRKPKGDRCYNCGGLDHHAKECGLPPQPKKCHYCQSVTHMVAQCPHKRALSPSTSQDPQRPSTSAQSQEEGSRSGSSSSPEEASQRGSHSQRWKKSRD
uniref:Lin-28 homolog B (C. elegans) n=2 Tax=Cyprinus carpio TaxID=7962 RepID=A0A8C1EP90_CYPCA